MRFLPINLDNVKNAAMLYVSIFSEAPWNGSWTYSTAYARLSAEIKNVGFNGYIMLNESGLPAGFVMGHSEICSDGSYDFELRELCFSSNEEGRALAQEALLHLTDELRRLRITTIRISTLYMPEMERFLASLGFDRVDHILCMQKNIV